MFLNAAMMDFASKIILLLLLIEIPCFIANSKQLRQKRLTQIDINTINTLQNLWTADENYFDKLSDSEVLARSGSKIDPKAVLAKPMMMERGRSTRKIPKNFDSRKEWPECYVIGNVKDQAGCGSCWAVATASAYSDRRCIAHKQKSNLEFSSEDILTCCNECVPSPLNGDGCQGGFVPRAWDYIRYYGVVTGGDYGSRNTCKPYSFVPCNSRLDEDCKSARAPKCQLNCTNEDYKFKYKMDKKFGGMTYALTSERSAKLDIMNNGPFIALFRTCYDFMHYKSGIYFHVFGPCLDVYHAVKVIGWGEKNGIDYWLVMNTWNVSWGDNGSFKIDKINHNSDFGYFHAGIVGRLNNMGDMDEEIDDYET